MLLFINLENVTFDLLYFLTLECNGLSGVHWYACHLFSNSFTTEKYISIKLSSNRSVMKIHVIDVITKFLKNMKTNLSHPPPPLSLCVLIWYNSTKYRVLKNTFYCWILWYKNSLIMKNTVISSTSFIC